MNFLDHVELQNVAMSGLGIPYVFGAKPEKTEEKPAAFDCSGFVRWVYGKCGITLPEGSNDQFHLTIPVEQTLQIGDLGFFMNQDGTTKHVGMLYNESTVIEARGFEPSLEAAGIKTNRVIFRAREKWEGWKEFSGWRRLEVLK